MINSLGFKAEVRPHKCKKSRYTIGNVSKKDLSKITREFEKLPYESYERRRPKYDSQTCNPNYQIVVLAKNVDIW